MIRSTFALLALLVSVAAAQAQVSVRAPFVRVDAGPPGGGVNVRAPFVNVNVPPRYPLYYPPLPQGVVYTPLQPQPVQPAPYVPQPQPVQPQPVQPAPYVPEYQPLVPPVQQIQVAPNPPVQVTPNPPVQNAPVEIPAPQVLPAAPGTVLVKARPMTHEEFARSFTPLPTGGRYEVDLIHPGCCENTVHVCFNLPPGTPCVRVGNRYIEYDYGRYCVEIRFALFGKVRVEYHD
jgi:hypothetical protein